MKEYIGSDEHFQDEVNADYDERERRDKEQQKQLLIEMMQEDEKYGMYDDKTSFTLDEVKSLVKTSNLTLEFRIGKLEERLEDLNILLDDARAELERKEQILSEYRNYIKW